MNSGKKILVVEDEMTNSILLKRILTKAEFNISVAHNGLEAFDMLKRESFDGVLTDWMMPQMDGIELIRQIRLNIRPIPFIIMITALVSDSARNYALDSGADDFISKPIDIDEMLNRLNDGLSRRSQEAPVSLDTKIFKETAIKPKFVSVVIGTSTGGPPTLLEIFKTINHNLNAAYFIVQHGPPWMLETFSLRLQKETQFKVHLAANGMNVEQGNIYVAPGDKHMKIDKETFQIILDDGPKENFVRPAADPLFRTASEAFGKFCIAVVLTGLGRDAALGASVVATNKGLVLVQDPSTAVAPSMPNTVIQSGILHKVVALQEMGKAISEATFMLSAGLRSGK